MKNYVTIEEPGEGICSRCMENSRGICKSLDNYGKNVTDTQHEIKECYVENIEDSKRRINKMLEANIRLCKNKTFGELITDGRKNLTLINKNGDKFKVKASQAKEHLGNIDIYTFVSGVYGTDEQYSNGTILVYIDVDIREPIYNTIKTLNLF